MIRAYAMIRPGSVPISLGDRPGSLSTRREVLLPDLVRDHLPNVAQDQGDENDLVEVADDREEIRNRVDRAGDVDGKAEQPPAGPARGAGIGRDAFQPYRQFDQVDAQLSEPTC